MVYIESSGRIELLRITIGSVLVRGGGGLVATRRRCGVPPGTLKLVVAAGLPVHHLGSRQPRTVLSWPIGKRLADELHWLESKCRCGSHQSP